MTYRNPTDSYKILKVDSHEVRLEPWRRGGSSQG